MIDTWEEWRDKFTRVARAILASHTAMANRMIIKVPTGRIVFIGVIISLTIKNRTTTSNQSRSKKM